MLTVFKFCKHLKIGARVLTGLMQKWRKIKGFRHSIIDNSLNYMHFNYIII